MATLDVHAASQSERLDAYRNVHEFWGRGLSLDEHLERRLQSPQHNRAKWHVGCLDGRVVASLGCYSLKFRVRGAEVSGIAIGSVHTMPEFRGRGFAAELFRYVEAVESDGGARLSLLYSDIDPGYYARLGYVRCESHEGRLRLSEPLKQRSTIRLTEFKLAEQVKDVASLYESFHCDYAVSIARDEDYWRFLCRKGPGDRFCWIDADDRVGYARFELSDDETLLRDFALRDHSDASYAMLVEAIIQFGRASGAVPVGGWLPRVAAFEQFSLKDRTREITMLKPLCPQITIDADVIRDAQHFREIDHV